MYLPQGGSYATPAQTATRITQAVTWAPRLLPPLIAQLVIREIEWHRPGDGAAVRQRALQLADEVLRLLAEAEAS